MPDIDPAHVQAEPLGWMALKLDANDNFVAADSWVLSEADARSVAQTTGNEEGIEPIVAVLYPADAAPLPPASDEGKRAGAAKAGLPADLMVELLQLANGIDDLDVAGYELLHHHRTEGYREVIARAYAAGIAQGDAGERANQAAEAADLGSTPRADTRDPEQPVCVCGHLRSRHAASRFAHIGPLACSLCFVCDAYRPGPGDLGR